jgi:PAP2 superfamily
MFTSFTNHRRRRTRTGWLSSLAAFVPVAAGADVITLFDEVAELTVTPIGVTYPAVTPEEIRTVYANDLATVHVAMYDAVVAIRGGYEPFAVVPTSPTAGASANAAAAAAACGVLRGLFPNRAPQYEPACQSYVGALPDGNAKTRGLAVGAEVAQGTLALRANDGRSTAVTYVPGSDPGDFRGINPALPFAPFMRPFALTSASQFRAEGPPDLTSFDYAKDLNEVQVLGSAASLVRTAKQTDLARFHTEAPPRFWPRNVRRLASDHRGVVENARLMALLWVAQADATVACFDSKYHFDFWRPLSAIPLADTDGNPATVADPAWTPVVPTPNHPEYPAAHACNAAAVAEGIERYFGTSKVSFVIDSAVAGLATPVIRYKNTADFVRDVQNARIYGGMHYRSATDDGATQGARVARFIVKNYFKREKK